MHGSLSVCRRAGCRSKQRHLKLYMRWADFMCCSPAFETCADCKGHVEVFIDIPARSDNLPRNGFATRFRSFYCQQPPESALAPFEPHLARLGTGRKGGSRGAAHLRKDPTAARKVTRTAQEFLWLAVIHVSSLQCQCFQTRVCRRDPHWSAVLSDLFTKIFTSISRS